MVYRAHRLAHRRSRPAQRHKFGSARPPLLDPRGCRHGRGLDRSLPDRVLYREATSLPGLASPQCSLGPTGCPANSTSCKQTAGISSGGSTSPSGSTSGQRRVLSMVRSPCCSPDSSSGHGVVRCHRLLHHGEWPLLARSGVVALATTNRLRTEAGQPRIMNSIAYRWRVIRVWLIRAQTLGGRSRGRARGLSDAPHSVSGVELALPIRDCSPRSSTSRFG